MSRISIKAKTIVSLLILSLFLLDTSYAETVTTDSESGFNQGTYYQTEYETASKAVKLIHENSQGNYTSQIFDAGQNSTWDSISWKYYSPEQAELFIIDAQKKAFSSLDGANWTTRTTDYGGTTSIDGIVSISGSNLILLDGKDIYSSSNKGVNWTKINDKFTPYTNDGLKICADTHDYLYIGDGAERIFKSTDSGHNWTEVNSNFNGAESSNMRGLTSDSTGKLFAVDGSGKVYYSSDQGASWNYSANYGGGSLSDSIVSDQNNYLYILINKEIYKSANSGLNWTRINNRFTPYSHDGEIMFFSKKNTLIISDTNGRIFESANQGLNWTELGDCNNASTSNPQAGTAVLYQANLSIFSRSCDENSCAGRDFAEISGNSPQNPGVLAGRYFQYKFDFETNDAEYSPKLYNSTIQYTFVPDTDSPSVQNIIPALNSRFDYGSAVAIKADITDNIMVDTALAEITLPDSSSQTLAMADIDLDNNYECIFNETLQDGNYTARIIANDTSGNINSTETTIFEILPLPDLIPPSVNNITPIAGTNFSKDSIVHITANVTDNIAVDTVFANLTNPDLTIILLQLFDDDNDSIYNNTIIANQSGIYYLNILANDTSGNTNHTEGTYFDPASLSHGGGGGGRASRLYQSKPEWKKNENEFATIIPETQEPGCVESWMCDAWEQCTHGIQSRKCEDYNKCGTANLKPETTRNCNEDAGQQITGLAQTEDTGQKYNPQARLTGMISANSRIFAPLGAIAVAGIIALFAYISFANKKKKRIEQNRLFWQIQKNKQRIISKLKEVYGK